jgi:hypothetical protein
MEQFFSVLDFKFVQANDSVKVGKISNFINFDFLKDIHMNFSEMIDCIHKFIESKRKDFAKIAQRFTNEKSTDGLRIQYYLFDIIDHSVRNSDMKQISLNIWNQMQDFINNINVNFNTASKLSCSAECALLASLPGCKRQEFHYDFDHHNSPEICQFNYFAIIGIDDGAALHYIDDEFIGSTIAINRGDLVICRGDLEHAGAEYAKTNVRIHFYLDATARVDCRLPGKSYPTGNFTRVPIDGYHKLNIGAIKAFNQKRKRKLTRISNVEKARTAKKGFKY